jgi:hypothetical protein
VQTSSILKKKRDCENEIEKRSEIGIIIKQYKAKETKKDKV